MNTQKLKSFLVVAKTLNFSKAAEELYIRQPSLSKQIAQLEVELEVKLFNRNRHSVELTPAGEILKAEGQDLIYRIDEIKAKLKKASEENHKEITVSFGPIISANAYWELLKQFSNQYPDVDCTVKIGKLNDELSTVIRGESDVAIVLRRDISGFDKGMVWKQVAKVPMKLACADGNPISKQKNLKLVDFKNEKLIYLRSTMDKSVEKLHSELFKYFKSVEGVDDWGSLLLKVALGQGIAFFPEYYAFDFKNNSRILQVEDFNEYTELIVVWLKCNSNSVIDKFVKSIEEKSE